MSRPCSRNSDHWFQSCHAHGATGPGHSLNAPPPADQPVPSPQGGAKPSQAASDADSYSGSDEEEEEEEQQEEAGPALVAPQEAVRRLKAFMEGGSTGGPGRPLSSILGSPGTAVGATTTVHMTGAVRRAAEKEAQYWDKLAGVLSQGTYRWGQLSVHVCSCCLQIQVAWHTVHGAQCCLRLCGSQQAVARLHLHLAMQYLTP